jgi:hypothetical protein
LNRVSEDYEIDAIENMYEILTRLIFSVPPISKTLVGILMIFLCVVKYVYSWPLINTSKA